MVSVHRGLFVALLFASLLIGCSGIPLHSKNGTTHYVILGLGIVSVKEQKGVSVVDGLALGLMAGKGGFTAGIGQHHDLEIDPNTATNVIISIASTPFSLAVTNFDPYCTNSSPPIQPRKGSDLHE